MYYWLVILSILALNAEVAKSAFCYECDSSKNFSCTEFWEPNLYDTESYLTDCRHVFQATHCIKMTGVFEGKLGTKRFCSSKTWGNYCEYIKRPGDIQEYRSCVFSCSSYGCNPASSQLTASHLMISSISIVLVSLWRYSYS